MLKETELLQALQRQWEYASTDRDHLVVGENLISYDGAPWMYSVSLMAFRGARVARGGSTAWMAGKLRSGVPHGVG